MGENKICSSCGNTIPAEAVFCPNCGSVQQAADEKAQGSEGMEKATIEEKIAQETGSAIDSTKSEAVESKFQPEPEKPSQVNASYKAPVQPVSPTPVMQAQQNVYPTTVAPQMQRPQQGYPQGQQPYQQQPYYGQPMQPAPAPQKPKKKFPWVFTIVWVVMLACLGIWGYFLFMDSNYQAPEITVDTVRVLIFVVSAILLIYTLNLKLITKKFKVVPTILLIIFLLASAFMFASFELVDNDPLHDLISPITDSMFQIE